MDDRQLELADVKNQFVEAEARLNRVAEEIRGVTTARETLVQVGELVGSAATEVEHTAADIRGLTEQLEVAASAIEQAEPGAIRDRLDTTDAQLSDLGERIAGIEDSILAVYATQRQVRLLALLAFVAAVTAAVLVAVMA